MTKLLESPIALVLTWNGTSIRVKCPYQCPTETHTHNFVLSDLCACKRRIVHCDPTGDENGSDTSSRSYRILFPFQEAPETEDMWWELDRGRDRWRTVSWNVYDPDYHEEHLDMQAIQTSNGVVENETAIVKAACRLSIGIPKEMVESKQWFDSHCVNDEFQQARNLLSKTGNTSVLINEKLYEDDKPLLVSVTEEGHHTIIDLLIQHGADLEVRDSEGYTALLRAVFHGHGTLAEKLLAAGSREDLKNNELSLIHISEPTRPY